MNYLLSPLVVMGIFILVAYGLHRVGGKLAPKTTQSKDKLMAYASGENIEGMKFIQSYKLFHVAFIFTVFHVAVLLLAMVPQGNDAIYALVFLGGLVISAYTLVSGGDSDE